MGRNQSSEIKIVIIRQIFLAILSIAIFAVLVMLYSNANNKNEMIIEYNKELLTTINQYKNELEELKAKNKESENNLREKLILKNKIEELEKALKEKEKREEITKEYFVKKGDTIASIAKKHNVTISEIAKWNAETIIDTNKIEPGQKIKIKIKKKKNN